MSDWTDKLPEAAKDYIGGRRVDEVECVIPDVAGVARGKAMPGQRWRRSREGAGPWKRRGAL